MRTRVQSLNPESSLRLCELLQSEESASSLTPLWQDRRPNYFDLYRHFVPSAQDIHSYGIWEQLPGETEPTSPRGASQGGARLWASSLLVAMAEAQVALGPKRWSLIYDTDCFIAPAHRSQHLVLELIRDRNALFQAARKDLFASGTRLLLFGIENQPGFLKPIAANPPAFGGDFVYGPQTVLHDIYPQEEEVRAGLDSLLQISGLKIEKIPLEQVPDSLLQKLVDLEAVGGERDLRPFPPTNPSSFRQLQGLDPKGELWLAWEEGSLQAACTVLDMSSVRKFRFNGSVVRPSSDSHPLFRLGLKPGDALRSLVVGRTWQRSTAPQAWKGLLVNLAQAARDRQFHHFLIRDNDPQLLGNLFKEVFHFKRRSLFWCLSPDAEDRALLQELAQGKWNIHWDNHYL